MTARRIFDLSDVLTVTTGSLVSTRRMDGVYDILNYMTGDSLFTHQIPRAIRAAGPALKEQHPQLSEITPPEFGHGDGLADEVAGWVDSLRDSCGSVLAVKPLADWHSMEPVQELAELTERPDRIVVVTP